MERNLKAETKYFYASEKCFLTDDIIMVPSVILP